MSRDFPDWINPWAAAQGRRRFAGTVPLRRMKRLAELTESDAGEAAFEARFFLDEDRRPGIDLEVAASLELMCQASLAPFESVVERRSRLGVIEQEGEMALLPPDVDPVLTDNGRLALATLVEDELILALPPAPRNPDVEAVEFSTAAAGAGDEGGHPEAEDVAKDDAQGTARSNPFAALKGKIGKSPDN